jgi:CRISPR-associated protein Cmr6
MSANIGWLFYKDYFKGINYSDLKDKRNESIIKEKVQNIINQIPKVEEQTDEEILGNTHFKATTTYPGLLLGSGNAHELPSIEGQAILGFSFDYTSGLPVIAGSSIKGVLRSVFQHKEYIHELLSDDVLDIKKLEKEIFDNGDIFHDATIIKADGFGKILGDDFLAPHGDNPLKNPIPLRFIKVLPNVTFRFVFDLSDGVINREKKAILFANILSDLGIGAKTNVGYGKFNADLVSKVNLELISQKEEQEKKVLQEKERKEKELEAEVLENLDSNVAKIEVQIKDMKDNKTIHETITSYDLLSEEKTELLTIISQKIGPKPAPKKKAAVKWAIRIYEYLEE